MAAEDHPLDYASFEGVIPEANYGAGQVIVWDTGTYRNISEREGEELPIADALADGHVVVWLEGRTLRGGYILQRVERTARTSAGCSSSKREVACRGRVALC
jgi:DNA ligase D-like protein (predicted 3'-phosphoesterase)